MTLDDEKLALLDEAADHPEPEGRDAAVAPGPLVRPYYRNVAAEDITERSSEDLFGALASHLELARTRPQGTARVRLLTPGPDDGWSAGGHSVVEVVTDDMPFLVDSLTMELVHQDLDVRLVVHPQMDVVRDITGELQSVTGVEDGSVAPEGDAVRESWMHVEVSRVSDRGAAAEIEEALQRVLGDVRVAVEDWPKMNEQVRAIVGELDTDPPPLRGTEIAQGQDLLRWLAADHFTFLGYREYRLETSDGDEVLRALPGTGLGILRFDQDLSSSFGKLPAAVRAKAREKTLLVLAKANSRATIHRPAYLDYVGIKTFDEQGEVVGERRFLGLFSSAAYTESVLRVPLLREKAREVLKRAGFDPRSHAGKALMDTLENYPRDELFHTPVDELAPIAVSVMHARERRQVKIFIRPDTYGRYVSAMVYLPRDRYNTGVRERFSAILQEELGGESVEFSVRLGESPTANVHFVVHPPRGGEIRDVDRSEVERRLAEASRSWRDDFVTTAMELYGEDRGARLARTYGEAFPEAYKEDYPAAIGAADLELLEAVGEEGIELRLYAKGDVQSGEGRLKVFRTGSPLSLSYMLPMLSSMGVEVVDERPYQLVGLGRPAFIYEFGLRYDQPSDHESPARFQDALRAVWDGFNEIDGFNRLVLDAGLTWRQATVLRAYAKYMRQGNSPFAQDYIEDALAGNVDITRLLVTDVRDPLRPGGRPRRRDPAARRGRGREADPAGAGRRGQPRPRPDPALLPDPRPGHAPHQLLPARSRGPGRRPAPLHLAQARAVRHPRPAGAAAVVRDLRLLAARRGRPPALRLGGARRAALVGPTRRLPDRGARPGQGADGQEHRDRAGGRQGRVLLQAAPRPGRPGRLAHRGRRLLHDLHLRAARHHRQPGRGRDGAAGGRGPPRRRRLLPGGRGRQGHRDVLRHRQRRRPRLRLLAGRRVRLRRLGRLRPQGDGHHRARRVGLGAAALPRARHRLPDRGVHGGRHRRHVRRRLRQRAAVLGDHAPGGRVRPPRHLPRPRPRPGDVLRRAEAALRAAPVELAGLRPRH